jgi:hypothetical protein
MQFPQYRKYSNNKSFFEVLAEDTFRELKILGQRYELIEIKATIWPDRSYILDLLSNEGGHYEIINREEFYKVLSHCQSTMQPLW